MFKVNGVRWGQAKAQRGLALLAAGTLLIACSGPPSLTAGQEALPLFRFVMEAPHAVPGASPHAEPSLGPDAGSNGAGQPEGPTLPLPGQTQSSTSPPLGGGGGSSGGGSGTPSTPSESLSSTPDPASPPPTPEPSQPPDCDGPCAFGPRQGQVVNAKGQAIPNASFWVNGSEVVADGLGQALLPAPRSALEAVVVKAAGHLSSAIAGWHEGALVVHLQSTDATGDRFPSLSSFELTGRVLDVNGQAAVGATVVLANAEGASGGPVLTDAQGRYRVLLGQVPQGQAKNLVVWAYQGMVKGNIQALGHVRLNETEAGDDLGDVQLNSPGGIIRLAKPLMPPFLAQSSWNLCAIDPTGPRLAFASPDRGRQEAPAFLLAGCQLEFQAQAQGDRMVSVVREGLSSAQGSVDAQFLRPPEAQGPLLWQAGAQWLWRPIPEALAYRVEGPNWEGATSLPRWQLPEALGARPELLRIVATTEGTVRQLAQVDTKPRALRHFVEPLRWSAWEGPLQP